MFPIDFRFNTLNVKVRVTFNIDSQCVNIVQSITSLVRLSLFKCDEDIHHMAYMFPFDLGVNWVKVKVTVTFNVDSQYVNLV